MNEHELTADRIETIARDAAREEAESVLDETTTADDGEDWSVRKLMDRFEIERRPAMIAFGLLAAGSVLDPVEAVLRAISQPADAQTNDLTVPGTLDAGAVSTDKIVIGGTLYEEDDNSPINVTGTTSVSYTFANSTDSAVVIPQSGPVGFDQFRVNGDTGSNYDHINNADAGTTGDTKWDVPFWSQVEYYALKSRSDRIKLHVSLATSVTGRTVSGDNTNVNPPISSLDFLDSGNTSRDAKARVYRRAMSI